MNLKKIFQWPVVVGLSLIIIPAPAFSLSQTKTNAKPAAEISVYFSPKGGIQEKIIAEIKSAKQSIKIAIYNFTAKKLAQELITAKDRGIKVALVADLGEADDPESQINNLIAAGITVHLKKGLGKMGLMHNKFAVFDEKIVITGSYNWTNNAEYNNYENAVFIFDPATVRSYLKEFEKLLAG